MKNLNEMKSQKTAILNEMESSTLNGGYIMVTGSNSQFEGSLNPITLWTNYNGEQLGADQFSGEMFGDSWANIDHGCPPVGEATINISSAADA